MTNSNKFTDGVPSTSSEPDFDTIIGQIKCRIVEVTASQNPTYKVEGHSYSKGEYLEQLGRQLEQMMKLRSQSEPFEIVSRGN